MGPPRKLYQQVAEKIADAIATGRYERGARLPAERDLADEHGVSRPTIREAMIALEMRHLVEARQGSGVYVSQSPPGEAKGVSELDVGAFELIEARMVFEGEAAALAATAISSEALAELEKALEVMAQDDRSPRAVDADRRFHLLIAEATGNSLVRSAIDTLWTIRDRSPLCVRMFAQARKEGVMPRVAEHQAIIDALVARDPQRAREAMRSHLRRVTDDLLDATRLELMQRAQADFDAQRSRIEARATA